MTQIEKNTQQKNHQNQFTLGVIGCPVKHSISPSIHQQFAQQFNHSIDYQKYLVEPENLKCFVTDFFAATEANRLGVKGLNVTLPHKQAVLDIVDNLTEEASLCRSVNTLFINQNGELIGDTTDGRGLLFDLNRLKFKVAGKNILVIGAGGASQSILVSLLKAGAIVELHNRSQDKVHTLVERFSGLGNIHAFSGVDLANRKKLDGVISSVSEFNSELMKPVASCIDSQTFCYDLNYGERAEAFRQFSLTNQCYQFSDGFGMLVGQAAHSYQIWTGCLPDVEPVIS